MALKYSNPLISIIYPVIRNPTGTNSYTRRIIKGLDKSGISYNKIPIKKSEYSLFGKPIGGIITQFLGSFGSYKSEGITHALSPEVARRNTDIVTIHDVIPLQYPELYIKNVYDKLAWKLMFLNKYNWKVLLASTEYGKRKISEKLDVVEEKIKVVYHSIEHDLFFKVEENPYPDDGKIHVLTVGDFNPRKKYDFIYNSISNNKEYTLFHIGPINGWNYRYNYLKRIADKTDNVKMLGAQPIDILRKYYSHADVFVYLTIDEGFGLPPLEAMACGTNAVVSDIPVFREIYRDSVFYTQDENLIDNIEKALRNGKSENELINFTYNYSLDKEINGLIKIYQSFQSSD